MYGRSLTKPKDIAEGHAAYGRSLISGRTVHANLNHYSMVSFSFATAFGHGFSFNKRWHTLPVSPRRLPLSVPGCIACPGASRTKKRFGGHPPACGPAKRRGRISETATQPTGWPSTTTGADCPSGTTSIER